VLAVLIIIVVASAIWETEAESRYPPLVSLSSQPDGSRALRLSLEALGYTVSHEVAGAFVLPRQAHLALLLEPYMVIDETEWAVLDDWVEAGGTLILAGNGFGAFLAAQHYEFGLNFLDRPAETLSPGAPLLTSPPLDLASVKTTAHLVTTRDDFVVLMAVEGEPVIVSLEMGEGRLILSASAYPFSNAGLKEAGNPSLVLNLIAQGAEKGGTIWFDEWHHGIRLSSEEIVGPVNWLRYTPTGHALLYVAVVVFLALVLQGRNFGRPLLPQRFTYRRAPLEHITAIANLSRRAGHRGWVLRQYHSALKRQFTRRYRINPSLDDGEFVNELSRYQPGLDASKLLSLLRRLRQPRASEAEVVQLAAEAVDWLDAQK
jgi:hypothetical protein